MSNSGRGTGPELEISDYSGTGLDEGGKAGEAPVALFRHTSPSEFPGLGDLPIRDEALLAGHIDRLLPIQNLLQVFPVHRGAQRLGSYGPDLIRVIELCNSRQRLHYLAAATADLAELPCGAEPGGEAPCRLQIPQERLDLQGKRFCRVVLPFKLLQQFLEFFSRQYGHNSCLRLLRLGDQGKDHRAKQPAKDQEQFNNDRRRFGRGWEDAQPN